MSTITIFVRQVVRETGRAFLFLTEDGEVWVPKSVIEDADEIAEGDDDLEIEVAEWFANKEGLTS